MSDPHLSRLDAQLDRLLSIQPCAALGSLSPSGAPSLSMAPAAPLIWGGLPCFVLHLSSLAAHTSQLAADPRSSLLFLAPHGEPLSLERVSFDGRCVLDSSSDWISSATLAYRSRFDQASLTIGLPDFQWARFEIASIRHVAGFGSARSLSPSDLLSLPLFLNR